LFLLDALIKKFSGTTKLWESERKIEEHCPAYSPVAAVLVNVIAYVLLGYDAGFFISASEQGHVENTPGLVCVFWEALFRDNYASSRALSLFNC